MADGKGSDFVLVVICTSLRLIKKSEWHFRPCTSVSGLLATAPLTSSIIYLYLYSPLFFFF